MCNGLKGLATLAVFLTAALAANGQDCLAPQCASGCDPQQCPNNQNIGCGQQINISGATLFSDFYESPAGTNDWIDADGDGIFGFDPLRNPPVDQLAPIFGCPDWSGWWLIHVRSVGSVEGYGEFLDYQSLCIVPNTRPTEVGTVNRIVYADENGPVSTGCGGCNEPSNSPICAQSVDLGILDVRSIWATAVGDDSSALWSRRPTQDGYGLNYIPSTTGFISHFPGLARLCGQDVIELNFNTDTPDNRTIFDTNVAWGPITYISNRGTGVEGLRISEYQHLFVTGRLPTGENLVAATRDVGSGTRNGIMTTSGIDASWGRGDNIGDRNPDAEFARIGPDHQPTNCGGSSIMEEVVQHRRLAIGYTGLAGSSRAGRDAFLGRYEVLNTMFDDRGGTQFVRPSVDTVLDNCDPDTGYQLGGEISYTSRGNPFELNPAAPTYMANQCAASFLQNIGSSIAAFAGNPPSEENFNMPGEYLALTFFLTAGIDCLPTPTSPTVFQPNPNVNQTLQDYIRANNGLGWGGDTPAYGSANVAGLVSRRVPHPTGTYTDGSADGNYADFAGNLTVQQGLRLNERNQIAGDFDNDGDRDADDLDELVAAVADPRGFVQNEGLQAGDPGQLGSDYLIPEITGDFNGDGDLDADDVRYAADGLAIDPATGQLDRKLGFTRVDGNGNYFGTTIATGKDYEAGDSRGDIAGNPTNMGGVPTGHDGTIDGTDVDYVWANYGDWANINQAVLFDLSADINGDLLVNADDADELVHGILCTEYGDVNLDGTIDGADLAIAQGNQGNAGGWADGDANGDGNVDAADIAIINANTGFNSPCLGECGGQVCGDANCDAAFDGADIDPFFLAVGDPNTWQSNYPDCDIICVADINGDDAVDGADIDAFFTALGNGSCP